MNAKYRRDFIRSLGALLLTAGMVSPASAETIKIRISLDTVPTHVRTKAIQRYADTLNQRAKGRLDVEVYHSAQLYRDRDVAKAVRQGSVEMAVPGQWILSAVEPNLEVFDMPVLYGLSRDQFFATSDGPIGKEVNANLEKKLDVKVIGRWLALGHANIYSKTKPVLQPADLTGLKIRFSGGAGQAAVLRYFKANPILVPWPDVPMALQSGTFDAMYSANDSVVSAKLWDVGLKYVYENRMSLGQYIPFVSLTLWNKLSPDLQKLVTDTWEELVPLQRQEAFDAEQAAARLMEQNGITIERPTSAALAATRADMLKTAGYMTGIKADPAFVERTKVFVNGLTN